MILYFTFMDKFYNTDVYFKDPANAGDNFIPKIGI